MANQTPSVVELEWNYMLLFVTGCDTIAGTEVEVGGGEVGADG